MLLAAGPFRVHPTTSRLAVELIPQGWAFFTRDPREQDILSFFVEGEQFTSVWPVDVRGFAWSGVDRRSRAYSRQLGHLISQVPIAAWRPCITPDRCEASLPGEAVPVTNPYCVPLVCGDVVLLRVQPVPWAWYSQLGAVGLAEKSVRLRVHCTANHDIALEGGSR
jgi:antimicrobial peptide system SdpA family protein